MPFEILVVVIGLGILVAIGFAKNAEQARQNPSVYSTYDTGPNGYRALYEVLEQERIPVERVQSELGLMQKTSDAAIGMPVGTLVISTIGPEMTYGATLETHPLDDSDLADLRTFVRGGGRLVVFIPAFKATNIYDALQLKKIKTHVVRVWGDSATEYPLGKGVVAVVAMPGIVSDENIAKAQNARFAYAVLAGHGAVGFYERLHGYALDRSFWDALPAPVHLAVWLTLAIAALGLIGANVRSAPATPLDAPDDRNSAAYLTGMASLMRRAHAARAAVATFMDDALRRARKRYTLPATAGAAVVAERTSRPNIARDFSELQRLLEGASVSDAALVEAAALHARLRRELG